MTHDALNLGLLPIEHSGKYGMPELHAPAIAVAEEMIPFNLAKTSKRKDVGVHFYIDDYQFERVWKSPQRYINMLKGFSFVLSPDFSVYHDVPLAVRIWNVYRSRLIARYWQDEGIPVIPSLQWADRSTYKFCFNGIEQGGMVSVSTLGAAKEKEARKLWQDGMREAIKRIHPSTILLYGVPIDFDFGNISILHYNNTTIKRMEQYGR